jgi:hypothetical protein
MISWKQTNSILINFNIAEMKHSFTSVTTKFWNFQYLFILLIIITTMASSGSGGNDTGGIGTEPTPTILSPDVMDPLLPEINNLSMNSPVTPSTRHLLGSAVRTVRDTVREEASTLHRQFTELHGTPTFGSAVRNVRDVAESFLSSRRQPHSTKSVVTPSLTNPSSLPPGYTPDLSITKHALSIDHTISARPTEEILFETATLPTPLHVETPFTTPPVYSPNPNVTLPPQHPIPPPTPLFRTQPSTDQTPTTNNVPTSTVPPLSQNPQMKNPPQHSMPPPAQPDVNTQAPPPYSIPFMNRNAHDFNPHFWHNPTDGAKHSYKPNNPTILDPYWNDSLHNLFGRSHTAQAQQFDKKGHRAQPPNAQPPLYNSTNIQPPNIHSGMGAPTIPNTHVPHPHAPPRQSMPYPHGHPPNQNPPNGTQPNSTLYGNHTNTTGHTQTPSQFPPEDPSSTGQYYDDINSNTSAPTSYHPRQHRDYIKPRSSMTRRDITWDGKRTTFDAFYEELECQLLRRHVDYLVDDTFMIKYVTTPEYIYSTAFVQLTTDMKIDISAAQAQSDIAWISGSLPSIITHKNLPALKEHKKDAIKALYALREKYARGGAKPDDYFEQLRLLCGKAFDQYNPPKTLPDYFDFFQTLVIKMLNEKRDFATDAAILNRLRRNIEKQPSLTQVAITLQLHEGFTTDWMNTMDHVLKEAPAHLLQHTPTDIPANHLLHTHQEQTQETFPTDATAPLVTATILNTPTEFSNAVNRVYAANTTQLHLDNTDATPAEIRRDAFQHTYNTFRFEPRSLNLLIPKELWQRIDPKMKQHLNTLRNAIRAEHRQHHQGNTRDQAPTFTSPPLGSPPTPAPQTPSTKIGPQYSNINGTPTTSTPSTSASTPSMDINTAINTVQQAAIDEFQEDFEDTSTVNTDNPFIGIVRATSPDVLDIHATFRHALKCVIQNDFYAISDGGADSTILGKHAHVINYTGRGAHLIGYDPDNTRSKLVPIVSAYQKSRLNDGTFVLLLIHEAAYLEHSSTTLLSEYQIRSYGRVIDSVATTHFASSNPLTHGKQRFEISKTQYIPLTNCGGIMGIQIFPYTDGDDKRLQIIEITSKTPWVPQRCRLANQKDDLATVDTRNSITAQHTKNHASSPPRMDFSHGQV